MKWRYKSENLPIYALTLFCLLDAAAFLLPVLGKVGSLLWAGSGILLLLWAVLKLADLLLQALRGKFILTSVVLCYMLGTVFYQATQPQTLSNETTQELQCLLKYVSGLDDAGFHETCLFGYPARQFLAPALFTAALGRTQAALNFGGGIHFVTGLIIFVVLAAYAFRAKPQIDPLLAITCALLFHASYAVHFIFLYEQSIFPLSFALIGCGAFLAYLSDRKSIYLFLVALSAIFSAHCYTPGLAYSLLCACILFFLSRTGEGPRSIVMAAIVLVSVLTSIIYRHDIKVLEDENSSAAFFYDSFQGASTHLLLVPQGKPFLSILGSAAALATLIWFVFGSAGLMGLFLFAWVGAVLAAATFMHGYTVYGIDFRLHKALVVLPILMGGFLYGLSNLIPQQRSARLRLYGLTLIFLVGTAQFQRALLGLRPVDHHLAFVEFLRPHLQGQEYHLLWSRGSSDRFRSFNDALQYFFPQMKAIYEDDPNLSELPKPALVACHALEPLCSEAASKRWIFLGNFRDESGIVKVFKTDLAANAQPTAL